MYTREEFEDFRLAQAKKMSDDGSLKKDAIGVLCGADKYLRCSGNNV